MNSISLKTQLSEFDDSIEVVKHLVELGESTTDYDNGVYGIGRETRGLAFVLLFAAYERLIRSISRELLAEAAERDCRLRELRTPFVIAGIQNKIESVQNTSKERLWNKAASELLQVLWDGDANLVDVDFFPDDGSFMKESQLRCFCTFFDLPDPGPPLQGAINSLEMIVSNRNQIAHGSSTPGMIGRRYSYQDIVGYIDEWSDGWHRFVDQVEQCVSDDSYWFCQHRCV